MNLCLGPNLLNLLSGQLRLTRIQELVTLLPFYSKKDLLTSRFIAFTDQPEAFTAWKTSFQGILKELCATPGEELDLLIKWLGAESKSHEHENCES